MASRRSFSLPITLAIVMILLLIVLTVGWVLVNVYLAWRRRTRASTTPCSRSAPTFLGVLLAGTIIYLVLTIKAINLNRRQSNFIDSVTHELKSPIASMKLYLQTLGRRHVSDEEREQLLRLHGRRPRPPRPAHQPVAGRRPAGGWADRRRPRGRRPGLAAPRLRQHGQPALSPAGGDLPDRACSPARSGRGGSIWTCSSAT